MDGIPDIPGLNIKGAEKQAAQIWAMLDDLAASDPEVKGLPMILLHILFLCMIEVMTPVWQGYKRFVARQMEEAEAAKGGAKKQFTPEPGFVVRVKGSPGNRTGPRLCFINVCHHRAVRSSAASSTLPSYHDVDHMRSCLRPLRSNRRRITQGRR